MAERASNAGRKRYDLSNIIKSLKSNEDNWVQKNRQSVLQTADILKTTKFSTEKEYINFLYDECKSIIAPIAKLIDKRVNTQCNKSRLSADNYRNQGNEAYKNKKFERSLTFYTRSILHAPNDSVELALAYANRSAVSFETFKFHNCMLDIKKCLSKPYPNKLKYKVYSRLGYCCKYLGLIEEGKQAYRNYKACLSYLDSTSDRKMDAVLNELYRFFFINPTSHNNSIPEVIGIPEPSYGKNPTFLGASAALDLRRNEEVGRHVVANRPIKRGDILFVEAPYASITVNQNAFTGVFCANCNACDKLLLTPCTNCCAKLYCSDECQQTAWNTYHRWECNGLMNDTYGISYLAMIILLKGAQCNFDTTSQDLNKCYGSTKNNYACVYHLVSNIDKMDHADISAYAMAAISTVYYLKSKTDFFDWFEKKSKMPKSKMARFLSTLLLRHTCQLQTNAHSNEMELDNYTYHSSALYPSVSMMNHSCNSNILTDYCNSYIIVRARKDIKQGEEVCNAYGCDYRIERTVERQRMLKEQYYFTCKCEACTHEKFKLYYEYRHAVKCPKCKGRAIQSIPHSDDYKCIKCRYELPPDCRTVTMYKKAVDKDNGLSEIKILRILRGYAYEDNLTYLGIYSNFYIHLHLNKNFDESLRIAKRYLEMIVQEFGMKSHVTANNMLDFSPLILTTMQYYDLLHNIRFRSLAIETLHFLDMTKERLQVYYGPWSKQIKRINEYIVKANAVWKAYLHFTSGLNYY